MTRHLVGRPGEMQEIGEFKQVIRALINASSSPCSEQEIKCAYWNETGFSVDAVLRKVGAPSFSTFIGTFCSEFCEVVNDGKLTKIYRKSCPKTKHLDHFTRAGERNFQQQRQPNYGQPQAHQQQTYNHELSKTQIQHSLSWILGVIFHNQQCYTANMNLLNNPCLPLPVLTVALQGLESSATNILNMTLTYNNLVSQAVIMDRLAGNLLDPALTHKMPQQFIDCVKQQDLALNEDMKQEKRNFNHNEDIKQAVKEENEAVAQVNHVADNFCEQAEILAVMLKKDDVIDIHVLAIESLSKFSFTYDDHGLGKLMSEMQDLYSSLESKSKVTYSSIHPGNIVAAKIFGIWHRAKVISGIDKDNFLDLDFIDFGTRQKVHSGEVCDLSSKFKQKPVRFLHGQCVLTTKVSSMPEALKLFTEKALNRKLYAKVVDFSENLCQMKVYDSKGIDFFSGLFK